MVTDSEPTADEIVDAIYAFAREQLEQNVPNGTIQSLLVDRGLDQDLAAMVIANLIQSESAAYSTAGKQNMIFGALWFFGGVAVTVFTKMGAGAGGVYIVAWGAIVFGAVQFIRGAVQCNRGNSEH